MSETMPTAWDGRKLEGERKTRHAGRDGAREEHQRPTVEPSPLEQSEKNDQARSDAHETYHDVHQGICRQEHYVSPPEPLSLRRELPPSGNATIPCIHRQPRLDGSPAGRKPASAPWTRPLSDGLRVSTLPPRAGPDNPATSLHRQAPSDEGSPTSPTTTPVEPRPFGVP
jgi:hypothetical protein